MRLYAHRGNCFGESKEENTTKHIGLALKAGLCAEVDVIYKDGKLYLGHDAPQEEIPKEYLVDDRILVHAKTPATFKYLMQFASTIHTFYQEDDCIAITSQGKVVHHSKLTDEQYGKLDNNDILVDIPGNKYMFNSQAYGVISDKVGYYSYAGKPKESDIFKVLILDIDGVLTNGTKTYDRNHETISKNFCDRDFTAIKRFQSAGIHVCALTGDEFNMIMCKRRNLKYYNVRQYSNQLDKTKALPEICKNYNVTPKQCAYVGDDYYDLALLQTLKEWSHCPKDAAQIVKDNVKYIIQRNGGEGAIEWLFEYWDSKLIKRFPYE